MQYPYVGYTEDELKNLESNYFTLVMGGDFVIADDIAVFTKSEVQKLYKKYSKDLINIVNDGDAKDRNYAMDLLSSMTIKPVRIH